MKIRKMTEYTEIGSKEKFQIVPLEDNEGWELTGKQMRTLRELINSALGTAPIFYIPKINIAEDFIDDVEAAVEKYGEDVVFQEPIFEDEDCPDKIEPPAPEVVCENGACTLVIPEEEVVEVKEKTKPGRKTNRDFSKYIGMFVDGSIKADIIQAMVDDWGITEGSGNSYYFSKVRPEGKLKQDKTKADEKEKKQLPKEIKPKINKKKVDQELFETIDNLPHYSTSQQFKDACAAADIGRGKLSIGFLKEIYLDTHPTVRW